jgi:hypothetical protein
MPGSCGGGAVGGAGAGPLPPRRLTRTDQRPVGPLGPSICPPISGLLDGYSAIPQEIRHLQRIEHRASRVRSPTPDPANLRGQRGDRDAIATSAMPCTDAATEHDRGRRPRPAPRLRRVRRAGSLDRRPALEDGARRLERQRQTARRRFRIGIVPGGLRLTGGEPGAGQPATWTMTG